MEVHGRARRHHRHQRRLQREPRLDGRRAQDARADRRPRAAHRSPCSARWASSASSRARSTTGSGGSPCGSTSRSSSSWARARAACTSPPIIEGSWDGESVLVDDRRRGIRSASWARRARGRRAREVVELGGTALPRRPTGRMVRVRALLTAGAFSLAFTLFLTPLFIRLFKRLGWGQFIRDDGPQTPPHQARHAHHGRHHLHPRQRCSATSSATARRRRAARRASALLVLFMMVGLGVVGFIDDFLKTRKQRSLGLGGWAKVAGQVIVADGLRGARAATSRTTRRPDAGVDTSISFVRDIAARLHGASARSSASSCSCIWVSIITWRVERRERRRRPRRARQRRGDPRDRLVHHHRLLAVQPVLLQRRTSTRRRLQVLRRARPARPRDRRRRDRRRPHRLPLVEHLARADLHGRHRLARPRRRPRRPRHPQPHRAAARPHRRPVPHRDRLGDRAARLLQAHRAASASS